MSNEIAQKKPNISSILAMNSIKALASTLKLSNKQLERANSSALSLVDNPALKNCDPFSLVKYCYSTARYNFSRDDACYPVPYGGKVQAQIGYQGYRELAMRTGKYSKIDCVEVKECDAITTDDDGEPVVEFDKDYIKRMNSKRIGFYGYAKAKDGTTIKRIFWTDEMAMKHGKRYSKTYGSLWGNEADFPKMAKKTIIKQLCKDLDMSAEVADAVREDQTVYGGNGEKDTYKDNPLNKTIMEEIDISGEDTAPKKTTVKNNIIPPKKQAIEEQAEEIPEPEMVVEETAPTPAPEPKPMPKPAPKADERKKAVSQEQQDAFDQFDEFMTIR